MIFFFEFSSVVLCPWTDIHVSSVVLCPWINIHVSSVVLCPWINIHGQRNFEILSVSNLVVFWCRIS